MSAKKSHLLTFAVKVTKYNKNNIRIINKINSQHLTGKKKRITHPKTIYNSRHTICHLYYFILLLTYLLCTIECLNQIFYTSAINDFEKRKNDNEKKLYK